MARIDGIAPDGKGNYLATEWRGKVRFVNTDGLIKELINSVEAKTNTQI